MPRSFHLTAESPSPAERILRTFRDERYWRARLAEFDDGGPTLDALATDADGVTSVTMTLRFGVEQLPAPLDRLLRGTLRLVHVERWHAADDGVVLGTITVDVPGFPMSGHGDLTITPTESGSLLAGSGVVDVRFPLVGGAVAGLVAGQLEGGIRDIHRFTDTWIAEHGGS